MEMNAGRALHKKLFPDRTLLSILIERGNSALVASLVARKRRVGRYSNYVFSWQTREEPILKPLKKS
jgi:hypothetical protein